MPFYKVVFTNGTYKEIYAENHHKAKAKIQARYKDQAVKDVIREVPTMEKGVKEDEG